MAKKKKLDDSLDCSLWKSDADADKKSIEMYGKLWDELKTVERLHVYDELYPEWKIVQCDHCDLYVEVSNSGAVRNPSTYKPYKIYDASNSSNSYPTIYVGPTRSQSVHRLVAKAFCPNDDPEVKTQVNHIDGNKSNNWFRNLEWASPRENHKHAYHGGLQQALHGEDNGNARYTTLQIATVCDLLESHPEMSFKAIANKAGVSLDTVTSVYRGKSWKHISEYYNFPPRSAVPQNRMSDSDIQKLTGVDQTAVRGDPNSARVREYVRFTSAQIELMQSLVDRMRTATNAV